MDGLSECLGKRSEPNLAERDTSHLSDGLWWESFASRVLIANIWKKANQPINFKHELQMIF